tara:strand:+ start:6506 stop:8434 length:1929 start_codon:yes stop_codon:yes gene_type:complete
MGVEHVAVHSDADADAPHLEGAVARVRVGPAPAAQSYLNADALISAALSMACDAVHPGYGFLSENAVFAAAVERAGLTFIGPTPDTIAAMGDKAAAKAMMARAGVPVVPGSVDASDDPTVIAAQLSQVGYPTLLKPVAGGGGKGMTVIESGSGSDAVASAIRTARAAFGDGRLLVERYVRNPRHVEVQVFGDGRGDVVHLFERECSLQRRHQKIVEEAPAAMLPRPLREALIEAALRGARAISYRNAGTFEFIVGEDGAFYFLEVNTRLQVEHPVTEAITGLDLVEWQLRVAAGEPLPLSQEEIRAAGHAIECRVYAEDAADGFRPAPGEVRKLRWPGGIRVESAVEENTVVPPDYDPMIAKLIIHGNDRSAALAAMCAAIDETAIVGLTTNLGFLRKLLKAPEVVAGEAGTNFIDTGLSRWLDALPAGDAAAAAAAAIAFAASQPAGACSPWRTALASDRATLDGDAPLGRIFLADEERHFIARIRALDAGCAVIDLDGEAGLYAIPIERCDGLLKGRVNGHTWYALVEPDAVDMTLAGTRKRFSRVPVASQMVDAGDGVAITQMPGVVVALGAAVGDRVTRGQMLAVVEAMKFENPVAAPRDGIVVAVDCAIGEQVKAGQVLVRLENEADEIAAEPEATR